MSHGGQWDRLVEADPLVMLHTLMDVWNMHDCGARGRTASRARTSRGRARRSAAFVRALEGLR